MTPQHVFPVDARQADADGYRRRQAVISSNVKVVATGASLDVPLGHKDDSWSFPHFDTITVSVADAPAQTRSWLLWLLPMAGGFRTDVALNQSGDCQRDLWKCYRVAMPY